jgi:hypothetical protein
MPRLAPALALTLAVVTTARATGCPDAALELYEPRSFLGYACEDDCQRQKAGFAWAERHQVTDPAACGQLEAAAADGCRTHVEESLTPEQAGYRWAMENEVAHLCMCDGAGEGFRAGCLAVFAEPQALQGRLRQGVAGARRAVSFRGSRPVSSAGDPRRRSPQP